MSDAILTDLDVRERLARIDQLTADAALKRQEFDLGYHKFWMSAIATAAALLGAGGAIATLLVRL
ncbi:MAG: hypothetical protein ABSC06_20180 [Rhodopila sp.]|jgi:hypothetical protein